MDPPPCNGDPLTVLFYQYYRMGGPHKPASNNVVASSFFTQKVTVRNYEAVWDLGNSSNYCAGFG